MSERDVVLVHSEVWVDPDGSTTWELTDLDSARPRRARGASVDMDATWTDIRRQIDAWFPDKLLGDEVRIVREHYHS